ncbi:hypothetical protein PR202_gb04602 [Eleusine coracana subsp. coracana]|uniref:ABC transporter domain-containing protein n=1 Tax=Eleusine coracana subsp. coracana TaxID=191504 RepID=A0AAV5E4R7_ELECO|nr:hypothetical protein PR202_gb04602 [Eleusine coracana subsp. coracana]
MAHSLAGGACPLRCSPFPSSSTAPGATLAAPPRPRRRVLASASSPPAAPAIEGRGVGLSVMTRRGRVLPVLKGCSLSVPQGQLWMLLGPNGCGKSTLLKVVMPTVESDVAFGLGKLNLSLDEVRSRVSKSLDAVGMLSYSQRPIQTLSGGQKQRVAIAGALAEASKVLLLDELTTFLDEHDQMGVIKAIKNAVAADGEVAALWVTHRLEELTYADGAIYMEDGEIIVQGDASTMSRFIKKKQARYFGHFEF